MRNLLRALAFALSIALLLPALASALSSCTMRDCPMVERGAPAKQPGHDCCPAADATLTAPCCEQHIETPAATTRLTEKPTAPAVASAGELEAGASPQGEVSWSPKTLPFRALDPLRQSCILRI